MILLGLQWSYNANALKKTITFDHEAKYANLRCGRDANAVENSPPARCIELFTSEA
jgi:hypothetical protein